MKLYTRDEILELDGLLKELLEVLLKTDERQSGDVYARIYPSSEGSADYPGSSYGRLF